MDEPRLPGEHHVPGFGHGEIPALTVAQGQSFVLETRDRFSRLVDGGTRDPSAGDVVGPVTVEGVAGGEVLAIEVLSIAPRTGTGYLLASAAYGLLGEAIESRVRPVPVSRDGVQLTPDTALPYRPMIGKLGVAPAGPALASTVAGAFGGALSATQLGEGAILLVRAARPGGGICVEDVHALMGDGEATASAVEMPAEVRLRASVYDSPVSVPLPLLLTRDEAVVFGEGESLDAAAEAATRTMLELLVERRGIDLTEAALLAGAALDVRVSFIGARPRRARAAVPRRLVGL